MQARPAKGQGWRQHLVLVLRLVGQPHQVAPLLRDHLLQVAPRIRLVLVLQPGLLGREQIPLPDDLPRLRTRQVTLDHPRATSLPAWSSGSVCASIVFTTCTR
jgi:hypothetical protein